MYNLSNRVTTWWRTRVIRYLLDDLTHTRCVRVLFVIILYITSSRLKTVTNAFCIIHNKNMRYSQQYAIIDFNVYRYIQHLNCFNVI